MNSPDSKPEPHPLGDLSPEELLRRGLETVKATSASAGAWMPPEPEHLSRLLPQYQIGALLGRGGMGAVYKGIQFNLERPVAIKLLPAEMAADPDFIARFQREARTLAKLSHPGIVMVHEFGQTSEGHLYFVMEFVDGTDLHQIIHGPGLKSEQALEIVAQICDALQYAHSQGVIHRDIKPANVILTRDGRTKLADFGLARPLTEESGVMTRSNIVMGTPDYIAPEAMTGLSDHRADLFSLGVMLYEMLTGQTPRGAWAPPSQRVRVDVRLDEVVIRALQQDPELRYQQASEMRTDVDIIRTTPPPKAGKEKARKPSGKPQPAPSTGAQQRQPKSAAKTRLLLFGTFVAIMAGAWFALPKGQSVPAGSLTTSGNAPPPNDSDHPNLEKKASIMATGKVSQEKATTSSSGAVLSATSKASEKVTWLPLQMVDKEAETKGFKADGGWLFLAEKPLSNPHWNASDVVELHQAKNFAAKVRFRYGQPDERTDGPSYLLFRPRYKYDTTQPEVIFWPSLSGFQIRTIDEESNSTVLTSTPHSRTIQGGFEGTLEFAIVNGTIYSRWNSVPLLVAEKQVLPTEGIFQVRGLNFWVRDFEYAILDGIHDPLKALGWDVGVPIPNNLAISPAKPPIRKSEENPDANVPWNDLIAELKSGPNANPQIFSFWSEEPGGFRVKRYYAFSLPVVEGRDVAVRLAGTFGPDRGDGKDQGFAIHLGKDSSDSGYHASLGNVQGGRAQIRKGSDTLQSFELTGTLDLKASHTLEFRAKGDLLTILVDGVELGSARGSPFAAGGKIVVSGSEGDLVEKIEYRYLEEPKSTHIATLKNNPLLPAWLAEARQKGGKLRFYAAGEDGKIERADTDKFDDFIEVAVNSTGWIARRADGETHGVTWTLETFPDGEPFLPVSISRITRGNPLMMRDSEGAFRSMAAKGLNSGQLIQPRSAAVANVQGHIVSLAADGTILDQKVTDEGRTKGPPTDFFMGFQALTTTSSDYIVSQSGQPPRRWSVVTGTQTNFPSAINNILELDATSLHVISRSADGRVHVTYPSGASLSAEHSALNPPADLGAAIAVRAGIGLCAAQMTDGTWVAWGDSPDLARKVRDIGPAIDLDFISYGKKAFLLWVEAPSRREPAPPAATASATPPPPTPPAAPAIQDEVTQSLAALTEQFQAAYNRDVLPLHQAAVEDLDQKYLVAIGRALDAASKAAKLTEAVQLRDETNRVKNKQPLPAADPEDLPQSLRQLRATYRDAFSKLEEERQSKAKPYLDRYDQLLEAYQTELTRQRRLDDAVRVKAAREQVLKDPESPDVKSSDTSSPRR